MHTEHNISKSPSWWNEDHDSRWDRVKAAFRRDWEQTKADFSGGRKGDELNQDIDDTMGQAFGDRPLPGAGTPNPMDADELEKHVKRSAKQMDRVGERLAKDTEKAIKRQDENELAGRGDQWEAAERPLRYGHGASRQYGPAWTTETERRMRDEWVGLYPEQRWDDVRDSVRVGWDRSRD